MHFIWLILHSEPRSSQLDNNDEYPHDTSFGVIKQQPQSAPLPNTTSTMILNIPTADHTAATAVESVKMAPKIEQLTLESDIGDLLAAIKLPEVSE